MCPENVPQVKRRIATLLLGAAMSLLIGTPSLAGRFVNLAETATFDRAEGEVIQATAFSTCSGKPCRDDILEFQTGVEYGLFRRFQVGFALPSVAINWSDESQSTEVGGTAFWGLYNFIDPAEKGWGLSGALIYSDNSGDRAGEMALLLEKPLGRWVVVYNGTAGRSWARVGASGSTDAMTHSLGASYQVSHSWYLGCEGDLYLEHDHAWETTGRYLGPNVSVDTGRFWVTASGQFALGSDPIIPNQVFQAQLGLPF